VIGGSAGGVPALIELLAALPVDFPLPILIVQHLAPTGPDTLTRVLGFKTKLKVKWAEQGELALPGHVYVAPRDAHLAIGNEGHLLLSNSARVRHWRPAVDKLFASAAEAFGSRTISIILSGAMDDGANGVALVCAAGGIAMTQDQASAAFFEMPGAAIDIGRADASLSIPKLAHALQLLCE